MSLLSPPSPPNPRPSSLPPPLLPQAPNFSLQQLILNFVNKKSKMLEGGSWGGETTTSTATSSRPTTSYGAVGGGGLAGGGVGDHHGEDAESADMDR